MDDSGRMYAAPEFRDALEKDAGKRLDVKATGKMPAKALAIESESVARSLAGMNRKARRIFMSERRRGADEQTALDVAVSSIGKGSR